MCKFSGYFIVKLYCLFLIWILFVFTESDCIFIVQQLSKLCLDSSWRRSMEKAWLCRQANIGLFKCSSESNVALLADMAVISVFLKETCLFYVWVCKYVYGCICIYIYTPIYICICISWDKNGEFVQLLVLLSLKKIKSGSGLSSYGGF